jgi:hypothetical protein
MKRQPPGESDWRRRQALMLASQLPENPRRCARDLGSCPGACRFFPARRRARARQSARGNAHSVLTDLSAVNEITRRFTPAGFSLVFAVGTELLMVWLSFQDSLARLTQPVA